MNDDQNTQANTEEQVQEDQILENAEVQDTDTSDVAENSEVATDTVDATEEPETPEGEESASADVTETMEEPMNEELEDQNVTESEEAAPAEESTEQPVSPPANDNPDARWYVIHTASGHESKVAATLKQRIESEHLEHKIVDVLVPTQDKIEIRGGKKAAIKEKIFPGYILVKMVLDDTTWLSVRTTPGVTAFVGIGNKPTPIPEHEVQTIVKFMSQGAAPTFKEVFLINDTVKIIDGPFAEFIGKVDSVDKERGKVRVLVSIFGRETPVELDFLQVQKL